MPKIAQNVDVHSVLCYNNSIRNGGNYSYFARRKQIILFNLYFHLSKLFSKSKMTSTTLGTDYFANFYFSWKETIEWTKSSESTLRRAIKEKTFPKPEPLFKKGGKVGFRKPDLILWAEGKRDWR
tara:strand:+ start:175 stop:549 length:375 start_codon:yes stop_codon:yes gene_type:complete